MVQFNLLPDIKLEFIKARRVKRLVVLVSSLISGIALFVAVLLFVIVNVWGKTTLKNLDTDTAKEVANLKSISDIDKILTIQNQLISLPGLHKQKPVASKLFNYITSLTPNAVSIAKFDINFTQKTIEITGGADKIESINKYVDTFKFTTFKKTKDSTDTPKAFSNVVLTSFGRDTKAATYKINLSYDSAIFDSAYPELQLVVPKIITTRSETEQPTALIDSTKAPLETKTGGTQ